MEITGMIMALICFVVVFPIAIGYLFYSKWRRYLWLAPIIVVIITGFMFIKDLGDHPDLSLIENVKLYFKNGISFGYVIYIPTIGISFISTVLFYLYDLILKAKNSRRGGRLQ